MQNSEIKVTKLQPLSDGSLDFTASLGVLLPGQRRILDLALDIVSDFMAGVRDIFLLEWHGDTVPYGASLGEGEVVGGAMEGCRLLNKSGEYLGTFHWLIENGGNDKHEQKMFLAID